MNESPNALDLLSSRVDELERRVHLLECPSDTTAAISAPPARQSALVADNDASTLETGNFFPIIGRAMLGIAGAYVLRAVAETGAMPKPAVSAFAVCYALGWLVWSARTANKLARVVYGGTSALIIAPLLWEDTLVFHVFTPMISAGVLAAFLTLATVLEIRSGTTRSLWSAQVVAVLTTAALAFATHQVLPFVSALLLAVFVSELARIRAFAQPLWPLLALISDVVLFGTIFVYAGPQNARAAYLELGFAALIAPASFLFALNGAALVFRVVARESKTIAFDLIQVMIAFFLAAASTLYFAPQHGRMVLGVLSLILSACAYVIIFRYLRHGSDRRILRWFGGWSATLLLAGTLWALPRTGAGVVLGVAAITAIYLARRMEPGMLQLHGTLFLVAAVVIADLPPYIYGAVAATHLNDLTVSIAIVAVCTAVALVVASPAAEHAWGQILRFVPALLAVCAFIALLVHAVLAAAASFTVLELHHVAFLRTLTICIAALAIAFGGARWGRAQLTHLAYVLLAFVAAKLFFQDLQHGRMEFIAGSFALFAITLITAPRVVRIGARRHVEAGIPSAPSCTPN